jgi:predicted nuclease with TOPRIM domain
MSAFQQSSREAYDRLVEESRAKASELASIKTSMGERIEDLEAQLDQIQDQYKTVVPELSQEAETCEKNQITPLCIGLILTISKTSCRLFAR